MIRVLLTVFLLLQGSSAQNNTSLVTINATEPSVPPMPSIHLNMSAIGSFKIYYPAAAGTSANQVVVQGMHSKWMQDDGKKLLFLNVGDNTLGDAMCIQRYWFQAGKHYTETFNTYNCSETPVCTCTTGYGYDEEMGRYNATYVGYTGRVYDYRLNMEIDQYAGRVLDGVGPLTVQLGIRTSDGMYVKMTTIEARNLTGLNPNLPYYNEYLYYDVNNTNPDPIYFNVPVACLNVTCNPYEFDYYGNKITNSSSNSSNSAWRMLCLMQVCLILALILGFY